MIFTLSIEFKKEKISKSFNNINLSSIFIYNSNISGFILGFLIVLHIIYFKSKFVVNWFVFKLLSSKKNDSFKKDEIWENIKVEFKSIINSFPLFNNRLHLSFKKLSSKLSSKGAIIIFL